MNGSRGPCVYPWSATADPTGLHRLEDHRDLFLRQDRRQLQPPNVLRRVGHQPYPAPLLVDPVHTVAVLPPGHGIVEDVADRALRPLAGPGRRSVGPHFPVAGMPSSFSCVQNWCVDRRRRSRKRRITAASSGWCSYPTVRLFNPSVSRTRRQPYGSWPFPTGRPSFSTLSHRGDAELSGPFKLKLGDVRHDRALETTAGGVVELDVHVEDLDLRLLEQVLDIRLLAA